jgi:hypothetical protein
MGLLVTGQLLWWIHPFLAVIIHDVAALYARRDWGLTCHGLDRASRSENLKKKRPRSYDDVMRLLLSCSRKDMTIKEGSSTDLIDKMEQEPSQNKCCNIVR